MELLRKEILLATNNAHKLKEYRQILAPMGYIIVSPKDLGIVSDPEETGNTYRENAHLKALSFARKTHRPVIADDSGLEVDSLLRFPGVHSSRFGESFSSYEEAQHALIRMVKATPSSRARFICTICYLEKEDAKPLFFEGTCEGKIASECIGKNGFGYDPIFISDSGLPFGLAKEEEKNTISHRHNAITKLAVFLSISNN